MAIYDDLNDRGSKADFVERCRRDFEATRNPLHAWEAWAGVRSSWRSMFHESIPLPEWLAEYFDACGRRLLGIPMDVVEREPLVRFEDEGIRFHLDEVRKRPNVPAETGEMPGSIGCALGFSESLAKAREHWGGPYASGEQLAKRAVQAMWDGGLSLEAVAGQLHGCGTSRATVKRAVRGAERSALRYMQDRLREATGSVPPKDEVARAYSRLCKGRAR